MATTTAPAKADAQAAPAKKGKRKLLVLVALVVLVAGGAAYWFLVRSAPADATTTKAAPKVELGAVVTVSPISVNLAGGHYLKIGIALQETASVTAAVDGSRALDAVISLYSGKPLEQLSDPAQRDALKAELVKTVEKDYDHDVADVYFTEYVMQ